MTRERAKELLPVIQAFADGKEIQCKTTCGDWVQAGSDLFHYSAAEYRIKPEPREFWIAGHIVWGTYNDAKNSASHAGGEEIIHVREVL